MTPSATGTKQPGLRHGGGVKKVYECPEQHQGNAMRQCDALQRERSMTHIHTIDPVEYNRVQQ